MRLLSIDLLDFSRRNSRAFTILEVLIVLVLLALVFGITVGGLSVGRSRLASAAYELTRTIQGLYAESIRSGKLHRLTFFDGGQSYQIERFELPKPRPSATDLKAVDEWEEEQRLKEEALRDLPTLERRRIDRGEFKKVKEGEISSGVHMKAIFVGQDQKQWDNQEKIQRDGGTEKGISLIFYPSGEVEQSLIVLKAGEASGDGRELSLIIEPMSGRVITRQGEVSKEDWIRHFGERKP